MITSIFKKSTPINYLLIIIFGLTLFFLYQIQNDKWEYSSIKIFQNVGLLLLFISSFFLLNFIVKKNILTRDSGYSILFFLIFIINFPSLFVDLKIVASNFFILLAIRRLISLQTLKATKEKIFDASLWIFLASIFHFWAILFILLVYASIIFHVSRDYKNWLLPIVAFFTTSTLFLLYALLYDRLAITNYLNEIIINVKMDYFVNNYQNIAFSIYVVFALFFVLSAIYSLTNKPLNLKTSYKKIIFAFFIGIFVFMFSTNKSNDTLVFTFLPLSIMATNYIEYSQKKIEQELVLFVAIICSLISFFIQL